MSKHELVEAYLQGRIDRREFISRLRVLGVSAAAAMVYAQSLGTAEASGLTRDENGFFVTKQGGQDHYPPAGPLAVICHRRPGGGSVTRFVRDRDVPSHLAHGDSLGRCPRM